jgi:hypothetical protein
MLAADKWLVSLPASLVPLREIWQLTELRSLPRLISCDQVSRSKVERAMGIEPTAQAWEAWVLPLYDARLASDSSRLGLRQANQRRR